LTRLINAHRANGQDANGFNSLAQLGYVARQEPGGRPIGYINLAVKRHCTAKISPLIVDPSARRRGAGEALLNPAPHDVRLLYCTVSDDNLNARTFFFRQGFVQVGTAPDQYRRGKTELILQRPRSPMVPVGPSQIQSTLRPRRPISRPLPMAGDSAESS
ncbi:N-acetyltransferase, partial [Auritidibacter sp. NML100628]|uniref:GNAT family N-acetyltransferase n=1 Tax=Auritidibacter sp. NML100628 TaxID=2170742 RepID=UPI000D9B8D09